MNADNLSIDKEQINRLINAIPIGILVLDSENRIVLFNDYLLEILDVNTDTEDSISSNFLFKKMVSLVNTYKSQKNSSFEASLEKTTGNSILINGTISAKDIIIKVEPEIISDEVEVESVQAILEGQENERRRIGREIHDGVGPMLSFIKLSFDSVIDEISNTGFGQPEMLKSISDTIDIVSGDLRALSHRLVPRTLDEFGLYAAFSNLIFKLNESKKAEIEFYSNITSDKRFSEEIELNIYRCAQEILNNAVKYSKASHILVQIILHTDSIILMIEDDGIGFDMAELQQDHHGIGLTNVETRVKLLEGEFTLDSVKGRGTVVSAEIPIKN